MASCLQKIPSGNESRAEGENDEMGIPNYRERSRLNEWKNVQNMYYCLSNSISELINFKLNIILKNSWFE